MTEDILILIASRHRSRDEIPGSYWALTNPISIVTEADIVRSAWSTLSLAPDVLATIEEGCVTFWRKKRRKLSYHDSAVARGQISKGAIQTK